MTKELLLAIEISNSTLAKSIHSLTENLPGVKTLSWQGGVAKKGPSAAQVNPDIILIDDVSTEELLERVRSIVAQFPRTALFVISENMDPQQIINVMKAGAAEYLAAMGGTRTAARWGFAGIRDDAAASCGKCRQRR